jgi:hypothetical protein
VPYDINKDELAMEADKIFPLAWEALELALPLPRFESALKMALYPIPFAGWDLYGFCGMGFRSLVCMLDQSNIIIKKPGKCTQSCWERGLYFMTT